MKKETIRNIFEAFEDADVVLDLMEQKYDDNPNKETQEALYMAVEEWTEMRTLLINSIYNFLKGDVSRGAIETMLHQERNRLKEIIES